MGVKNKLLQIRLQNGYKNQKEFAKYLEINQYQYSRYENNINQPSLEILIDISLKLNCKIDDIVYKSNE